jgi:putative NADH-flavin reductase
MVTALARDPARLGVSHPHLVAVAGDVLDPQAVAGVMAGQDAVLSCIGPGRLEGDLGVLSAGMAAIIAGMRSTGVQRIVAVAAAGILQADAETLRRDTPAYPSMLQALSAQHLRVYELLQASGTHWTLACPPTLIAGDGTGGYRAERDYLPEGGERIAYADVALFLLDELESGAFVGSRVGIAE